MKLLHKLLPVATIASVAAIVTPLVTSCNKGGTFIVDTWDAEEGSGIFSQPLNVSAGVTYSFTIDMSKWGYELSVTPPMFIIAMAKWAYSPLPIESISISYDGHLWTEGESGEYQLQGSEEESPTAVMFTAKGKGLLSKDKSFSGTISFKESSSNVLLGTGIAG